MASKKRPAPRKKPNASAAAVHPTSAAIVAARNLLNMAAVMASCATILLCLMIVKKF